MSQNTASSIIESSGVAAGEILGGVAMNKLAEKDPSTYAHLQEVKLKTARIFMFFGIGVIGIILLVFLISAIRAKPSVSPNGNDKTTKTTTTTSKKDDGTAHTTVTKTTKH